MIGAWCFLDHYGPEDVSGSAGMQVWAHPHTGLQTVSWLLDGEIEHRDSLGSQVMVRPGELNIMTAGHGIVHSEISQPDKPPLLHGYSSGSRCRTLCATSTQRSRATPTCQISTGPGFAGRC